MSRRGLLWAAAFIGGVLVVIEPTWLGVLLVGWALVLGWRVARTAVLLLAVMGLAVGWVTRQQTQVPPVPAGPVRVMPTAWTIADGLARYTGKAANGVPVSGAVPVTPVQIAQLKALTTPVVVSWRGTPTRLSGARNLFEFDYATYAWRQNHLAYQSPNQPLVMRPVEPANAVEALYGLRAQLIRRLAQLPPKVRAYAKGLLLGQLDDEFTDQRQAFVDLGIFHLFSVSGLHLFVLIGGVYWITDRLRLPKEGVDWVLLGLLPTLLILIPPGAGIMRAVWLRIATIVNARTGGHLSPLDCFSATLMLNVAVQPYVLHTFGGQMTYLMTGALLWFGARGRWGVAWRLGVVGVPVILAQTYQVHLLTVGANWLLMPVFELGLMPLLVVVSVAPALPLTGVLETVLRAADRVLAAAAQLPGKIVFGALPPWLAMIGTLLVVGALIGWRKRWVVLWLVCTWAVVNVHPNWRVVVFDVGQGDAILIEAPFKQATVLIDTGGRGFGTAKNPPAQRAIVNYLHARGISRLDALVLTHADADHVGDAAVVTHALPVTTLVTTPLAASHAYMRAAEAGQVGRTIRALAGDVLAVGPLRLQVVAPAAATATEKNADSLVLYGTIDGQNWLFTGDADRAVELGELLPQRLAVDVLKVGHHGSRTSTDPAFIAAIRPQLALISAGVANRYGHPHQETLTTLKAASVPWATTAESGMLWVEKGTLARFLSTGVMEAPKQ